MLSVRKSARKRGIGNIFIILIVTIIHGRSGKTLVNMSLQAMRDSNAEEVGAFPRFLYLIAYCPNVTGRFRNRIRQCSRTRSL